MISLILKILNPAEEAVFFMEKIRNRDSSGKLPVPAQILKDLGVMNTKTAYTISRYYEAPYKYLRAPETFIDLAVLDVPIGPVLKHISESKVLNPPRTCHTGCMYEVITRGGGGEASVNQIILTYPSEPIGYFLIFDFNEVPSFDGTTQRGDTIYYPGYRLNENGLEPRDNFCWNGQYFEPTNPSQSYFTPFLMTNDSNGLLPLTLAHRRDIEKFYFPNQYRFLSDVLLDPKNATENILRVLLEKAVEINEEDRNAAIELVGLIANRTLRIDGTQVLQNGGHACPLYITHDNKFQIGGPTATGGEVVSDIEAVLERIMAPIKIAADPSLLNNLRDFPKLMPRLSRDMLLTLMAIFNVDFYDGCQSMTPFNPHFHWGAKQMVGAPPRKQGYYKDAASRNVQKITEFIRMVFPGIPPVLMILLPAYIFSLFPNNKTNDYGPVNNLVSQVFTVAQGYRGRETTQRQTVESTVETWWRDYKHNLSQPFISRFWGDPTALPPTPETSEPEKFGELTFREASQITGALSSLARFGDIRDH